MLNKIAALLALGCCLAQALLTGDQWSDIANTPNYQQVPGCAQSCVLQVNNQINCWSYGCVCSEHTLGTNYNTSLSNIASCAAANCTNDGGDVAVASATEAFQQLCQTYYITEVVSTVTVTGTSVANATPVLITITTGQITTSPPSAVPTFQAEDAIKIDEPTQIYQSLNPCLRFVFNGCSVATDNSTNCNVVGCSDPKNNLTCVPSNIHDHTQKWMGLGVDLQCTTTDCVCNASNFFESFQHLFDEAQNVCDVSMPATDAPSPDFESMGQMITEYCSSVGGAVLTDWILHDVGYEQQSGLSTDAKVGMAYGIPSLAVTAVALFFSFWTYKRKKVT